MRLDLTSILDTGIVGASETIAQLLGGALVPTVSLASDSKQIQTDQKAEIIVHTQIQIQSNSRSWHLINSLKEETGQ